MRVSVGNIKGRPLMKQPFVLHDCNLLMEMGKVALACEVGISRYNKAFRDAAKARNRRVFFERKAVQVAVPDHIPSYGQVHRLSRGLKFVNPSRYLNVVFCPETNTAYGSIHMTNGAWNSKKKSRKSWRRKTWLKQELRAAALISKWRAEGWNIIIGGDMNRNEPPRFHDAQVVAKKSGIIQLIVIPARGFSATVKHTHEERYRQKSDHPFISASITFQRQELIPA